MVRETGKRRGSRIELDYYRGSDRLTRWRGRLCLLVIACIALWLGLEAIASRDRRAGAPFFEPAGLVSKGPLAQAHAMWDSTCEACHVPFAPINHSRWAPVLAPSSHDSDDRCRTCHAAPPHHQNERQDDIPSCAECHRDHRGRSASLLAMDDSACTRCHADLSRHRVPGGTAHSVETAVTSFDIAHHPEFTTSPANRATSPGRIKFSHARHVAVGLTLEPRGLPFTSAQIAPSERARFGFADLEKLDRPVRLGCTACHQLDGDEAMNGGGPPNSAQTAPRTSGAYMLPVSYGRHCAGCHPLAFDAHAPEQQVRHGLFPAKVVGELKQFYAAQAVADDPALLRQFMPSRPLPDRSIGPAEPRYGEAIEAKVVTASRLLFGAHIEQLAERQNNLPQGRRGCVECHNLKPHDGPLVRSGEFASLEIEPVLMTPVWFESAVFNHTAHRALDCAACHAGVYSSRQNGDRALLPGIEVCANCHFAEGSLRFGQPPGASARCTECHLYHDGDHPRYGPGAIARRGTAELSVEQFRKGQAAGRNR
jgi:predicted CXXCH cytochrome family protein